MKKVTLFCAAALFSLLSFAQNDKGDIVKTGDKMPAFTLTSTVNGTVNSADLKGKVVLINIFATWCGPCQSELAEVQKDYQKLSGEKEILQGIADRYNRLLRMLGKDMVERLVQDDIRMQAELEAKKQKEQMPKKISDRIPWAKERSEEYNAQIKKDKAKYRGMEL